MADKDSLTKLFVKNKNVFADAFNYYLHGGREIIKPEQLSPVDTTEVVVPYGEDDTGLLIQPVQKIRDSFYSIMTTDRKVYMLCGIENQMQPHNAMPLRNALYDIMEYIAQAHEAQKAHMAAKNYGSQQDFLSGFHTSDKLIPVYTLVIYWGPGEWNAPKTLYEMMALENEDDHYGLNDWKINLIIPDELTDDDVAKFNSDLGKALLYIKNMGKPEMIEKLSADERYRTLNTDTVLLLNEVMNADFPISREEATTDMCYAVEKIKENAAVFAVIKSCRRHKVPESEIINEIREEFDLTLEEAEEYLQKSKKSA